jgi:hypothetical protein
MILFLLQFLIGRRFPFLSRVFLTASLAWAAYEWWRSRRRKQAEQRLPGPEAG